MAALFAVSLLGTLLLDVSGAAAAIPGPGHASTWTQVSGNSCHGVFQGNPPGSLIETTSAGANQNIVSPNQNLTVTLNWLTSEFGGNPPSKTDVCVEIASQISATLSQEHRPGPSNGYDTFMVKVPDGTGGAPICMRGAVSGPATSTEKSAILCYSLMAAVTPEIGNVLLLPAAGLLVAGGAVLLSRRRRAAVALQMVRRRR